MKKNKNRYAISDIHGCCQTFKALINQLHLDQQDELYLLGDYIDRSPDSKGVIDYILHLRAEGYIVHALRGNHEQMMIDASIEKGTNTEKMWMRNGGVQTMMSYYESPVKSIPDEHFHFLDHLPACKIIPDYAFVHAGFNFETDNPLEDRHSMLWIRNWYEKLDHEWLGGRIIIHGHTPRPFLEITAMLNNLDKFPVIDIDCGCVFTHRTGMGYLLAFDLDDRALIVQRNID